MQLNTYLLFNGQCEAAFRFYARCLGGEIDAMMTYADSPAAQHVGADWGKKIIHAQVSVGDQVLMGSDPPPEHAAGAPRGFAVSVQTADVSEAERIFRALSEGGQITMPLAKTFFSPLFGMLEDRFGVRWMVNVTPA